MRQQTQPGSTLKYLFVFLLLSTVCVSLGLETLSQAHGTPDVVRVVQSKFKAFNEHDVSTIERIYAADAVLHSPDYPELAGNTAIAGTYKSLFDAIPDARDAVQNIIGSDDKVVVEFVLTGHFGGVETKPVHARIVSIYTVKHAHIIADSTYYDRKQ
jgi:ketosteroid isomerase-like protein